MRAIQYDAYGGIDRLVLRELADRPGPAPREGARVRVAWAALNPKDALVRKGRFARLSGRTFPKQCGLDYAGEIVEPGTSGFAKGDRVFGFIAEWKCLRGTLAEYVDVRDNEVARLPESVSSEDGAAVPLAALTSLQALRDVGRVGAGARVLVNGAAGGVGTFAVQIGRILGAKVTSVSSAANLALCKDLGAEETLDYGAGDILVPGAGYDCIYDVFGNLKFDRARKSLAPRGTFVSTVPSISRLVRDVVTRIRAQSERLVLVRCNRPDLDQLGRWLASSELRTVIDSRFTLETIGDAFRRIESRHTRGKILVAISSGARRAAA